MITSWQESYDKLRRYVEKQKHYSADKGRIVKAMVFLVVMYDCERWTTKKTECHRFLPSSCGAGEDS